MWEFGANRAYAGLLIICNSKFNMEKNKNYMFSSWWKAFQLLTHHIR